MASHICFSPSFFPLQIIRERILVFLDQDSLSIMASCERQLASIVYRLPITRISPTSSYSFVINMCVSLTQWPESSNPKQEFSGRIKIIYLTPSRVKHYNSLTNYTPIVHLYFLKHKSDYSWNVLNKLRCFICRQLFRIIISLLTFYRIHISNIFMTSSRRHLYLIGWWEDLMIVQKVYYDILTRLFFSPCSCHVASYFFFLDRPLNCLFFSLLISSDWTNS